MRRDKCQAWQKSCREEFLEPEICPPHAKNSRLDTLCFRKNLAAGCRIGGTKPEDRGKKTMFRPEKIESSTRLK